ncbi:MAG: hypothetical protein LQ350_000099 [Teloschistes chrysophthalmus]|nr:MAG: hypothetical protein LQ350_000099 [Niorma chrysophthalma]
MSDRVARMRILMLSTALLLLFLNPALGFPPERALSEKHLLATRNEERIDMLEMIERRATQQEAGGSISKRNQRMYPMHFTKAVAALPTPILAQVLEQFYDDLIRECEARIQARVPIGVFADIKLNKLKLVVISSGRGLSWAFIIRFAQRMRGMIGRNSGLSTYEAYYSNAPGDVIVHFSLQLLQELSTLGQAHSY